jgi:hypothetical protein
MSYTNYINKLSTINNNIKDSLEINCIKKDLKFYNINIYGSLARRINVGLIYAHALFSSEEIIKIKKAIYECVCETDQFEELTTKYD